MSRFLVDTQLLLWNVYGSRKLPARVARLFRDGRHQFFYSAASLWEIAIKAARGREDFAADTAAIRDMLEENGFHELPVSHIGRTPGRIPGNDRGRLRAVAPTSPPIHPLPARNSSISLATAAGWS